MGNLLSIDFYKIFRTKFFYVIGLVLSALNVISTVTLVSSSLRNYEVLNPDESLYFGSAWSVIFSNFSNISLFLVILTILFLCSEFAFGTMKNIATKGYPREFLYLSKFFVSLACMGIYLVLTFIVSFVTSLIAGGNKLPNYYSMPSNMFMSFIFSILFLSVYASVALLIASLVRKSGNALAIYVVITMVLGFVPALLRNFFMSTFKKDFDISKYLYSGCFAEITQKLNSAIPSSDFVRYFFVAAFFLVVTLGAGIYYFKERDI